MPIDPNALLASRPVETPNMLGAAGQAASLAEIMARTQMMGLQLQQQQDYLKMLQDPRYQGWLSSMLDPNAGGSGNVDTGFMHDFPMGTQLALNNAFTLAEKSAQIGKNRAETEKSLADTMKAQLGVAANYARNLAANPDDTDAQQAMQRQLWLISQSSRVPPNTWGTVPQIGDTQGWQKYATRVEPLFTDQAQAATIAKTYALLPGQILLQQQDLALNPQKVAISQQEANTAAARVSLDAYKFNAGEAFVGEDRRVYQKSFDGKSWNVSPAPMTPTPAGAPNVPGLLAAQVLRSFQAASI